MAFARVSHPALFQASLGQGIATVLGPQGLRLTGLTSFHLDEGPDFAWLNIYRTLAGWPPTRNHARAHPRPSGPRRR